MFDFLPTIIWLDAPKQYLEKGVVLYSKRSRQQCFREYFALNRAGSHTAPGMALTSTNPPYSHCAFLWYPVGNVLPVTQWLILSSAYKSWQSMMVSHRAVDQLLNWSTAIWDTIMDCQGWYVELSVNHRVTRRPSRSESYFQSNNRLFRWPFTMFSLLDAGSIIGNHLMSKNKVWLTDKYELIGLFVNR